MKLYMFPVAPNPTKVRLYLAEKAAAGSPIDLEEVPVNLPKGEQHEPAHLARNPRGTLPVLELDDGSYLTESLPIIEYLEELHPEPPLIGADARERARVRELERCADILVLICVARIIHASNSPTGRPANPAVAAHYTAQLPKALRVFDELLSDGRPFVAGDAPRIVDCTLAAALQFARFREVEIDPGCEHLARWDAGYRERGPARAVLVL